MTFYPGAKVKKHGGNWQATGTIVACFRTLSGETRYVFEFDNPKGLLFIVNESQIELHP